MIIGIRVMAGPSLQKYKRDLKALDTHMEELKTMAKKQHDDNNAQISGLATQMAETSSQISSLSLVLQATSLQAKAEREEMTNQLQGLMEVMKIHSTMLKPTLQNQVPINNENCASNVCYTSIVTPVAYKAIKFGENAFTTSNTKPNPILHTPHTIHTPKSHKKPNSIVPTPISKTLPPPQGPIFYQGSPFAPPPRWNHQIEYQSQKSTVLP